MTSSRILVVGGGGFIGRNVVSMLHDAGYDVAVLDMAPPPPDALKVDWVTGSISDATLVASTVAGCMGVIFLANASLPGSSQGDMAREASGHVAATLHVAETCKDQGVERFLFASSGGTVYGYDAPQAGLSETAPTCPLNGYGVSKLSIEHYLRLIGRQGVMRTLSLRISNPYGEGQRAVRAQGVVAAAMQHAMADTVMPVWGDGTVERDLIHIEDVARAFTAGLRHDGPSAVINIGSGEAVSVNEILETTRTATGRTLVVDYQPDRAIDVQRNVLDISRAEAELGWAPRIDLKDGIARTARWWATRAR
ncbi:NAD-dependent epimerase/dehydratase family protein [Jannaschia sp.]|nr:NAD-dependent epimerase/dehydratase family protein [Jannaschia sp.]